MSTRQASMEFSIRLIRRARRLLRSAVMLLHSGEMILESSISFSRARSERIRSTSVTSSTIGIFSMTGLRSLA